MIQSVPASLEEVVDPKRAALLLWDMQVGVASRAHNLSELLPVVHDLLDAAREAGVAVIWALHVPAPREFMPPSKLRHSLRIQGVGTVDDPPSVIAPLGFLEGFEPLENEWVIKKPTQSFFVGTDLEIGLRGLGIDSLILAGVATEMGV